jgi:hypothetical protein
LAEEFVTLTESNLATKDDLSRWALRIVLANGVVMAALLALYGFAS